MTDREAAVLAAVRRFRVGHGPAVIARVLNLDGPCDWCPVGKKGQRSKVAIVPRSSADAVRRELARLVAAGRLVADRTASRYPIYLLPGDA